MRRSSALVVLGLALGLSASDTQPIAEFSPTVVFRSAARVTPLTQVQPVYPATARVKGIQGMVRIRAVISREGVPTHFKVVQGPRELISAALEALQKWRYRPCIIGGKAVEVKATFDVILPKKLSRAKGR